MHQQIGNTPIVNTTNKRHMLENISTDDFTLTNEEIESINSRLRYDLNNCDFTKL